MERRTNFDNITPENSMNILWNCTVSWLSWNRCISSLCIFLLVFWWYPISEDYLVLVKSFLEIWKTEFYHFEIILKVFICMQLVGDSVFKVWRKHILWNNAFSFASFRFVWKTHNNWSPYSPCVSPVGR